MHKYGLMLHFFVLVPFFVTASESSLNFELLCHRAKIEHELQQYRIERELFRFLEREQPKEIRKPVDETTPFYKAHRFLKCLEQGEGTHLVEMLKEDPVLRTSFRPARELSDALKVINEQVERVRRGEITTGVLVKLPDHAKSIWPYVKSQFFLAAYECNEEFLMEFYQIMEDNSDNESIIPSS